MSEFIQIQSTTPSETLAQELASELVSQRLAGCVQVVGPAQSFYRWEGALESATEWRLLIKTTSRHWPAIEAFFKTRHPYAVPELIVTKIAGGSPGYLDWLQKETMP